MNKMDKSLSEEDLTYVLSDNGEKVYETDKHDLPKLAEVARQLLEEQWFQGVLPYKPPQDRPIEARSEDFIAVSGTVPGVEGLIGHKDDFDQATHGDPFPVTTREALREWYEQMEVLLDE